MSGSLLLLTAPLLIPAFLSLAVLETRAGLARAQVPAPRSALAAAAALPVSSSPSSAAVAAPAGNEAHEKQAGAPCHEAGEDVS